MIGGEKLQEAYNRADFLFRSNRKKLDDGSYILPRRDRKLFRTIVEELEDSLFDARRYKNEPTTGIWFHQTPSGTAVIRREWVDQSEHNAGKYHLAELPTNNGVIKIVLQEQLGSKRLKAGLKAVRIASWGTEKKFVPPQAA